MTGSNTEEIILQAIEKLIERDNPSIETIKMQVFDVKLSGFTRILADSIIQETNLETNLIH